MYLSIPAGAFECVQGAGKVIHMTDTQSIYNLMYDHAEFYRPPREEHSAFLEVAYGCSWGACAFCDFIKDEYKVYSLKDVARKAQLLSQVIEDKTRVHILGCNPLGLPQDYLLDVFMLARRYLPQVTEYSMYARSDDVLGKSESELAALKRAGLTDVHVGIESGADEVLAMHNKGETAQQMIDACLALEKTGIACHISLIPGLGGRSRSRLHAEKTAALLSKIHPSSVWCIGLAIWEGTPLADMIRSGAFDPMDYREMLEELRYMVSLTEMEGPDCTFTDSSVLGLYTVEGKLPSGKADLLHVFDQLLAAYPVAPGEIRYDGPSVIG